MPAAVQNWTAKRRELRIIAEEIGVPMSAVIASIHQRRDIFRMDLKTRALAGGRLEPPA
jgi:hypothetical protein